MTAMEATRVCAGACASARPLAAFSRNQLLKENARCRACVTEALAVAHAEHEHQQRLKRCTQCFQDLPRSQFSKRQAQQLDGKCRACVSELEQAAARTQSAIVGKWQCDRYYRCCHRGKNGGVAVRTKCSMAAPVLGHVPLGRVVRATDIIYNEQGDPMVRLATFAGVEMAPAASASAIATTIEGDDDEDSATTAGSPEASKRRPREGWIGLRSIRNEILLEPHGGPWVASTAADRTVFYRCVIEGCKVRAAPDLGLVEIGYVLYGDVVEVTACELTADGVVFLRLHERYFDGPAWVVERTLDNESVLNAIPGPSTQRARYRCVQDHGAPFRREPSLAAPPAGRIPCGLEVTVIERIVTPERLVFLRLEAPPPGAGAKHTSPGDDDAVAAPVWVIETSTVCASVMIPCRPATDHKTPL